MPKEGQAESEMLKGTAALAASAEEHSRFLTSEATISLAVTWRQSDQGSS